MLFEKLFVSLCSSDTLEGLYFCLWAIPTDVTLSLHTDWTTSSAYFGPFHVLNEEKYHRYAALSLGKVIIASTEPALARCYW